MCHRGLVSTERWRDNCRCRDGGSSPATIIALLDHNVATAITVVVIYCALNIILQSVIQPRVVGTTVGLSGTLSFLSLLIWTTILGGIGALLAVPASLFVKALFVDVDPDRRWLTPLLSSSSAADAPDGPSEAIDPPAPTAILSHTSEPGPPSQYGRLDVSGQSTGDSPGAPE